MTDGRNPTGSRTGWQLDLCIRRQQGRQDGRYASAYLAGSPFPRRARSTPVGGGEQVSL